MEGSGGSNCQTAITALDERLGRAAESILPRLSVTGLALVGAIRPEDAGMDIHRRLRCSRYAFAQVDRAKANNCNNKAMDSLTLANHSCLAIRDRLPFWEFSGPGPNPLEGLIQALAAALHFLSSLTKDNNSKEPEMFFERK
jgi:hypothetical protein